MTTNEILIELEFIRTKFQTLRRKNKAAKWFGHLMKANEAMVDTSIQAINHIRKISE